MSELEKYIRLFFSLSPIISAKQILARFEEFPTKKLEALRTAGALYRKLDGMMMELQNWKIAAPLPQLMDKVDQCFNKVTQKNYIKS